MVYMDSDNNCLRIEIKSHSHIVSHHESLYLVSTTQSSVNVSPLWTQNSPDSILKRERQRRDLMYKGILD